MIRLFRPLAVLLTTFVFVLNSLAEPRAQHVFIISIDGGKPSVIQDTKMPCLENLVSEGAHTWVAQTIFPSITLPSHTSMLTGVGPDKHKILWNDYRPTNGPVKVPTVFFEAKMNGYSTAMFVGKEKFLHLAIPNTVDTFDYNLKAQLQVAKVETGSAESKNEGTVMSKTVAADAAAFIKKKKPNLCFIHLTDADATGHKYGWGSPEQMKALEDVDKGLAAVMKAIREAGIADDSVVIVSADHGGHNKTHGSKDPQDMNIPWIVWGKNVKKDFTISAPVSTCDTAATALWLLDVPVPDSFDGRPVTSAFE